MNCSNVGRHPWVGEGRRSHVTMRVLLKKKYVVVDFVSKRKGH
jgi:hypothetical protein